jgi:hypothetical protein
MREVANLLPVAPPPMPDPRTIIVGLVRFLARFRAQPFVEQRAVLTRVVRSFKIVDAAVQEITISGAYVGELASHTKIEPRSTASLKHRAD